MAALAITQAVTDEEARHRAIVLGEQIRAEDGIGTAVTIMTQYLSGKESHHAKPEKSSDLLGA